MRDKRRDSGEYYPGGRVIARPGTAPQQVVVQWSDVQNKPQVAPLPERYKDSDVKTKINEIASKFATVVVAALIVWTACADVTVQKKRKDEIYNDELVVVDVTGGGSGGIDTNAVERIANKAVETNAVTVGLSSFVSGLQSSKADKATTYTRAETDAKLEGKADATATATALSSLSSTVSGIQSSKVDKTTKVNGKPLSANVTLRTSDIENDSGYISNGDGDWQRFYWFSEYAEMFGVNSKILRAGDGVEKGEVFYLYRGDYDGWGFNQPFVFVRVKEGGPFSDLSDFIYGRTAGYAHAELLMDGNVRLPSLSDIPGPYVPSASDPTFSSAVLSVGLNIDAETLQWLKDIGAIAGTTTGKVGIGTLLAALLAALMWLKTNKADKSDLSGLETYVVTDAVDGGVSVKINGETVTMFADLLAKCQTGRAVLYGQATTVETGYAFYTAASVTDSVIQFQVSGMLYDKSNIRYGMYVRRIKIVPRANGGLLVDDSGLEGPFVSKDYVESNKFATDLLGKQVANVKANTVSLAADYSKTATYAVGDAVTHDGKLYKCKTAISPAGVWNPDYWTETTVATLWNNADTTSYGGQN